MTIKMTLRSVILGGLAASGWIHVASQRSAFEVKDSAGRVRMVTQEDGDRFSLRFLGPDGSVQSEMRSGKGGPELVLSTAGGDIEVACGLDGVARIEVRGAGGRSVRVAAGGAVSGWDLTDGKGEVVVAAQTSQYSTITVRDPDALSDATTIIAGGPRFGAGLAVSQGGVLKAGLSVAPKDKSYLWLGEYDSEKNSVGPGFLVGRVPEFGVMMRLQNGPAAPKLQVQANDARAAIQMDSKAGSRLIMGVSEETEATVIVRDKSGKEVASLPPK